MKDYSSEVKPLTAKEKAWIKRAEKVLMACPKRFMLQTIGDPSLTVVDADVVKKYNIETHDGLAGRNGVEIAHIDCAVPIHGVSG